MTINFVNHMTYIGNIMRIFIFSCLCIASLNVYANNKNSDYVYHYWDLKASDKRDAYQYRLLELALEKTIPSFGQYQLTKNNEKYTSLRSHRELERGETVNIIALPTPTWPPKEADPKAPYTIKQPLLRGLLGYRGLVIRRTDLQKFKQINSVAELQHLAAGQGRDWEDINIYRYNNYTVVDNADYLNLFAMLAAGRFDYIPLSVIEIDDVMARFSKYAKDFVVVPNLIIYYPFPVIYNISSIHPELVNRLNQGLNIAQSDGSLKQLFESYFADELEKIKVSNLKVFILKSPNVPKNLGIDTPVLLHDYTIMQ
jgi:ABC-type amino acid transport substrate-binding protein